MKILMMSFLLLMAAGCTGPASHPGQLGHVSGAVNGTFKSATQNSDGSWTVVCNDGTTETDSADAFAHGMVCQTMGQANPSDPFDPASCTGATLTVDQALNFLDIPAGKLDVKIGRFQAVSRTRSCFGGFPCGDWTTSGVSPVTANSDDEHYDSSLAAVDGSQGPLALKGEFTLISMVTHPKSPCMEM